MKFFNCCGRINIVLDMLLLNPLFGTDNIVTIADMKIFTSGCVPLVAGSLVVAWEMKIFISGFVPF